MPPRSTGIALSSALTLACALALAGCDRAPDGPVLGSRVAVAAGQPGAAGGPVLGFDAVAGRSYLVRLEQFDVDLAVELRGQDGKARLRVAAPSRNLGREYLFWTAPRSERVDVAAVALGAIPTSGTLAVEVTELRADLDASLRTALQQLGTPARLDGPDPGTAQRLAAAESALRAGRLAEQAADAALQLSAYHYWTGDDWRAALEGARRAARGFEQQRADADPARKSRLPDALLLEGAAMLELVRSGQAGTDASYADAMALLARAREGFTAAGRPADAASALLYTGTGRYYQSDHDGALDANRQARTEFERLQARDGLLRALQNIATIGLTRGEYRGAADALERLLRLLEGGDVRVRLSTLQNSAIALQALGESEQALGRYVEALGIARSLGEQSSEARILNGLGIVHLQLGQPSLAAAHLREAVQLATRLDDRGRRALALQSLAEAEERLGQGERAVATMREALRALGEDAPPLRRARVAVRLAGQLARIGATREAMALFGEALARLPDSRDVAVVEALVGQAAVLRAMRRFDEARGALERAAPIAAANGSPQAGILVAEEQARLAQASASPDEALRVARLAAGRVESLLEQVRSPDNRVTLATRLRAIYDLKIELLAEAALDAARRGDEPGARTPGAMALLAVELAGDRAALGSRTAGGVTPEAAAAERRAQELYERLAGKRQRLETLAERHATATPEMASLASEVALLQTTLAAATAAGAAPRRTAVDPATSLALLDGLQRRLAPQDMLLVYRLGERRSWLWTVERDALRLYELPPSAAIARPIEALLRDVRRLAPAALIGRRGQEVRSVLLPAEVARSERRRWVVMADGPTSAVPWALVDPQPQRTRVEVVSLATVGATSGGAMGGGTTGDGRAVADGARPLRVALLADPVFGPGDPRLAGSANRTDLAATDLPRLPGGLAEIDAIRQIAGERVALRLTGTAATREALLGITAARADVLHVATHARLDTEVPQLSAIVMSRFDDAGRPVRGEIRAWDILRVQSAPRLVVLSACDAAASPSLSAPGLVNLARAFLSAGSEHVVASLWPVSDAGAVAFMDEFYRALLGDGAPPEEALRVAQSRLATSPRFAEPFFWSGFVVMGRTP